MQCMLGMWDWGAKNSLSPADPGFHLAVYSVHPPRARARGRCEWPLDDVILGLPLVAAVRYGCELEWMTSWPVDHLQPARANGRAVDRPLVLPLLTPSASYLHSFTSERTGQFLWCGVERGAQKIIDFQGDWEDLNKQYIRQQCVILYSFFVVCCSLFICWLGAGRDGIPRGVVVRILDWILKGCQFKLRIWPTAP